MSASSPNKSTIVRLYSRLALVRAAVTPLDRLAPGLAARLALRLWLTTPRRRPTGAGKDRTSIADGEWFTVPLAAAPTWATRPVATRRQFAARGRIVAECWGSGPVVYLLHGWGGARTDLRGFVAPLVAAGTQVVALDAAGHGESGSGRFGGRRTTLPELADSLAAVAAVTGPAHAIISHSAGCQATALAVREGLPAERLVFLAPMTSPEPYLDTFHRLLGTGADTQRQFRVLLAEAAGRALTEFDLPARAAEADKLPELLVIHDDTDRESPPAGAAALAAAWPDARLITTSGLGHRRMLGDPAVINQAVAHVTGRDPQPGAA